MFIMEYCAREISPDSYCLVHSNTVTHIICKRAIHTGIPRQTCGLEFKILKAHFADCEHLRK